MHPHIWSATRLADTPYSGVSPFMTSMILIGLFTVLAGAGDAEGFIHAGRVWQDGRFVWLEALKCFAAFQFGLLMFWLALWKLAEFGNFAIEIQALLWFVVTTVGVGLFSGRLWGWPAIDQVIAVVVAAGVGWLTWRQARS